MTKRPAVLFLVLLTFGCGVPLQSAPVPVEPEAIPSQLRGSPGPTAAPTTDDGAGATLVQVHFVRDDKLVGLRRELRSSNPADRLRTAIDNLLAGPTEQDQSRGLTSALPPQLRLTVKEVQGQRAIIDLTGQTDGRSATENVLAVGQIVLTATSLPGITEVTFTRDGQPVETLLADGALTTKPLTAADYAALRAQ